MLGKTKAAPGGRILKRKGAGARPALPPSTPQEARLLPTADDARKSKHRDCKLPHCPPSRRIRLTGRPIGHLVRKSHIEESIFATNVRIARNLLPALSPSARQYWGFCMENAFGAGPKKRCKYAAFEKIRIACDPIAVERCYFSGVWSDTGRSRAERPVARTPGCSRQEYDAKQA